MRIILILLLFPFSLVAQDDLRIIDGDTIHLNGDKIRFSGIDTPEINQICKKDEIDIPCGAIAKKLLIEKLVIQLLSAF